MSIIDERIRILDKIEALLNKTTLKGASEAEAQEALLMAHKLMAKYHISDKELKTPGNSAKTKSTNYKAMAQWSIALLQIVAENFRCKSYLQNHNAAFVGEELDMKLAIEMYKMLVDVADKGARKIRRDYRKAGDSTEGVANSYLRGFLTGIKEALEAQRLTMVQEDSSTALALALDIPQSVLDLYDSKVRSNAKKVSGRPLGKSSDRQAYHRGHTDGSTSITKQLN